MDKLGSTCAIPGSAIRFRSAPQQSAADERIRLPVYSFGLSLIAVRVGRHLTGSKAKAAKIFGRDFSSKMRSNPAELRSAVSESVQLRTKGAR
jgi:hypothetical protein